MKDEDIDQVLEWRNHPEVRRYMYTQHEIMPEEHQRWFNLASQDPTRHLLVYERDGVGHGYAQLHCENRRASWGFYLAPNASKGSGSLLGRAVLDYAFLELDLHKVIGEALAYNQPSIHFHKKLGFIQEGLLRQHHYDGQHYHDVFCFGLLQPEWIEHREKI